MKSRCFVLAVVLGVVAYSSVVTAQGFRGRGGPGFGGGGATGLLMSEQVREELEIVPDQLEKLQEIGKKGFEGMREMWSGMRDLNEEERRAKFAEIREKMQERQASMQEEVNKILLPHQVERLTQIQVQMQMRRGTGSALEGGGLAEKLGITDAQKEQLVKVRAEVEKELAEKMAKIRAEAEEKILGVLTPAQQKQLKEMRGESFEFQRREGDGGRRPGGRGPGGGGGT